MFTPGTTEEINGGCSNKLPKVRKSSLAAKTAISDLYNNVIVETESESNVIDTSSKNTSPY